VLRGGGASISTLHDCVLQANFTEDWRYGSYGWGGGAEGSTLRNCLLTDNVAAGNGGGAFGCTLYNCVVSGNTAGKTGGGVGGNASQSSTLYNCIVYYNAASSGRNYANAALSFCCTTPLPTNGVGNVSSPPLFADLAAGDYRLREDSPCIDAGTNLLGFPITTWRYLSGDFVTVGAVTGSTDILGNTRFIDGNGDGIVAWDIGVYEFNSFEPPRFRLQPQLTAEGWRLTVTGASNRWVRLEWSGDLKDWQELGFVSMDGAGVATVNDSDTGTVARFYRVAVP
jgi:hypothetical protein